MSRGAAILTTSAFSICIPDDPSFPPDEQAIGELAGFRVERKLTQRFRAAQTVAVLSAAEALLHDVKGVTAGVAKVPSSYLQEVAEGIAELQPLIADISAHNEEIDDEI